MNTDTENKKIAECLCSECVIIKQGLETCLLVRSYSGDRDRAIAVYKSVPFVKNILEAFTRLLGRGGSKWPRLRHILEFCLASGIQKVGIGCCSLFLKEAHFVKHYLSVKDIQSIVVCCKIGGIQLKDIDINCDSVSEYFLCNPVGQIQIFNSQNTELNLMMGLCIGHDIIFSEMSNAPVTTLFIKEHKSGHTPYSTLKKMMEDNV